MPRAKTVVFAVILVMMGYVLVHNERFLVQPSHPDWQHYGPLGWPLVLHGVTPAMTGPLLKSPAAIAPSESVGSTTSSATGSQNAASRNRKVGSGSIACSSVMESCERRQASTSVASQPSVRAYSSPWASAPAASMPARPASSSLAKIEALCGNRTSTRSSGRSEDGKNCRGTWGKARKARTKQPIVAAMVSHQIGRAHV